MLVPSFVSVRHSIHISGNGAMAQKFYYEYPSDSADFIEIVSILLGIGAVRIARQLTL